MLYKIAHVLRDNFPFIWNFINIINSSLFSLRYSKNLNKVEDIVLNNSAKTSYRVVRLRDVDAEVMSFFFTKQPIEAYTFFHPHAFDVKSIKKLQQNKAFLAYVLLDNQSGAIVGYCFNRSFFHGKGFRGRIVDIDYRGKGLGTMMNKILNEIGFGIGLNLYETVSKDNIASYRSTISASNFKIVEELPHNELYIEILPE